MFYLFLHYSVVAYHIRRYEGDGTRNTKLRALTPAMKCHRSGQNSYTLGTKFAMRAISIAVNIGFMRFEILVKLNNFCVSFY